MTAAAPWTRRIIRTSPLKRQKWDALRAMVGETQGLRCLDIGSDNGVISALLRERGGRWTSADLDAEAVEAIRSVVGEDVVQLNGRFPFGDAEFDRAVLVDCLEHVQDDRAFLREVARVVKSGGEVTINVPLRKASWLRSLRVALGQTDEAHGHVRSGYTADELQAALGERYALLAHRTYSKFFSQAVDTLMTLAIRGVKRAPAAAKGTIITGHDLERHRGLFALYALLAPALWFITQLDHLLWCRSGYMLLAKAKVRS